MQRRHFLFALAALLGMRQAFAATAKDAAAIDEIRKNWKTLLAKNAEVAVSTEPVDRSNAVWRQLLTPAHSDWAKTDLAPGRNAEYAVVDQVAVALLAVCVLSSFAAAQEHAGHDMESMGAMPSTDRRLPLQK